LGTTFAVRAYPSDTITQVAVRDGRVAVRSTASASHASASQAEHVLQGGDVARVTARGALAVRHDASASDAFGWTTGRLTFDKTPLREIIPELERRYDIDIRVADPALADRRLTITLTSESTPDMLELVTVPLSATYVRHGRSVVLSPR
jgi:ferric-dicitrate binding protein FerR (iron transport regulator)